MITHSQFSDLLSEIYDAALEPARWQPLLARLISVVGATNGALVMVQPRLRKLHAVSTGADPLAVARYNEYYGRLDPVSTALARTPAGTILTPPMILPRAEHHRLEFYVDWANPHGVGDGIFATLLREPALTCGLVLAAPVRDDDFASSERLRFVERVVPHLQRAVRVQARLEALAFERDKALEALDRLSHGIFVLSQDGRLVHANRTALDLCAKNDGLTTTDHTLHVADPHAHGLLQVLIARAGGNQEMPPLPGSLRVPRRSGRRAFVVLAIPLSRYASQAWRTGPGVLVAVSDPESQSALSEDALRTLFNLTPAEASVASLVLRGHGLKAVADELEVTLSTVRVHLQRVFEKTGTHRQAELVRLLLDLRLSISTRPL